MLRSEDEMKSNIQAFKDNYIPFRKIFIRLADCNLKLSIEVWMFWPSMKWNIRNQKIRNSFIIIYNIIAILPSNFWNPNKQVQHTQFDKIIYLFNVYINILYLIVKNK